MAFVAAPWRLTRSNITTTNGSLSCPTRVQMRSGRGHGFSVDKAMLIRSRLRKEGGKKKERAVLRVTSWHVPRPRAYLGAY